MSLWRSFGNRLLAIMLFYAIAVTVDSGSNYAYSRISREIEEIKPSLLSEVEHRLVKINRVDIDTYGSYQWHYYPFRILAFQLRHR